MRSFSDDAVASKLLKEEDQSLESNVIAPRSDGVDLHDEQPHCAMRNRAVVSRQTVRQSGRLRRDDTRNLRSIWRKHFERMEGAL